MDEFECTENEPWTEGKGRAFHPDSKLIEDADGVAFSEGNKTTYLCPYCSLEFKVTQPDY